MINANQILASEENEDIVKPQDKFSFKWMAEQIIERQNDKKDTIIVVVGERRNGKSNWTLKLIRAFIKLKKEEDPDFKWSWDINYPITRSQAVNNVENIPNGSFNVYDEGGDIAYRGDTMTLMNKKLIKFMMKSGKKCLLTIIVLPDIFVLDPKILNMAIFMVVVPYRYKSICSFAFIYGRNPNPLVRDKFGLERVKRMFQSRKAPRALLRPTMTRTARVRHNLKDINIPYPYELFKFLKSLPTYLHMHTFRAVDKLFEEQYIRNVKDKQLTAHEKEDRYIPQIKYEKLLTKYRTLIHNLYSKGDMKWAQLERFHIDKFGNCLARADAIKRAVNSMEYMEEIGA